MRLNPPAIKSPVVRLPSPACPPNMISISLTINWVSRPLRSLCEPLNFQERAVRPRLLPVHCDFSRRQVTSISDTRVRDDLVLLSMVGPEALAVKRQRAGLEADTSDVVDLRFPVPRVDARQPVVVGALVVGRREVEAAFDDHHPTDAVRHVDDRADVPVLVKRKHSLVVPLTQVEAIAAEAELRASIVGTLDRILRAKSVTGNEAPNDSMIVGGLAAKNAQFVADDGHAIRQAGRLRFFSDGPTLRVDRVQSLRFERAHPERLPVECQRLRTWRGRGQAQEFFDILHSGVFPATAAISVVASNVQPSTAAWTRRPSSFSNSRARRSGRRSSMRVPKWVMTGAFGRTPAITARAWSKVK